MGSPLGLTLANAFCVIMKRNGYSCPTEFKPKLYKRHIDDIFVMFQSRDHVKKFVDCMNTNQPNIRFMYI